MLTIRLLPTGSADAQHVTGTLDTEAELRLWAEAVGAECFVNTAWHPDPDRRLPNVYASVPTMGNGVGGAVLVWPERGQFVSWWVTA